jgi:hypothetical protein
VLANIIIWKYIINLALPLIAPQRIQSQLQVLELLIEGLILQIKTWHNKIMDLGLIIKVKALLAK